MNLPTLCLITDRARLVASLGRAPGDWRTLLMAQVEGAAAGGVDVVQVREKDLDARELARLVRDVIAAAGPSCQVVVNDRLDVARAVGAWGVHLREQSVPIAAARGAAGSRLHIGRSIHAAGTARSARTADYLIAGHVFPTPSKPDDGQSLGLDALRGIVQAAGACPVWAVGGITDDNIRSVMSAGVRGVAAIGAFVPGPCGDVASTVQQLAEKLRISLASAAELP